MRSATKTVATWLGILAGIAGLEHGYFETLQGNTPAAGLMFPSWGTDICDPAKLWHACEPAMSLLPNFRCSPNHCGIIPRPRGRGTPASRLDQAPCPFIILLFSVSIGLHFARRRLMEHGGVASHLGSADARYILHYFGATSTPA